MTILAWHFVAGPLPGVLRDGRPVPPDGEWLKHEGEIVLCSSGLHASESAIDALRYSPGSVVCRVDVDGEIQRGSDKLVGRRRRVLWRADATDTLRVFAREQALSVSHLWEMPDVVRRYLETGDEALRTAAWDAARDAASAAARDAARDAAREAARAAAWAAARDAAWDAAWEAAWAAAWEAAWAAAWVSLARRLEELKP